jgi:hypothetical protein
MQTDETTSTASPEPLPSGGASYKGVLATPMPRDGNGGAHLTERFDALFEHFGVDQRDTGALWLLLHELAMAHVPGFRLVPKAGRPVKWTTQEQIKLALRVQALQQKKLSLTSACIALAAWSDYRRKGSSREQTARTLADRFRRIRKSPLWQEARLHE